MSEAAPVSLRSLNGRLGIVGRFALLSAVLGAIVLVLSMRGLGSAVFVHSAKEAQQIANEQRAKLVADYTTDMDVHVKQFNGRSVFFVPSAPVPVAPPPPKLSEDDKKPPPPPPPPVAYGGPKLIAMINGVAWFDDGKKLSAADEVKDKLKVKELLPPWKARVEWDGVEFTIKLFEGDNVIWGTKAPEAAKEAPKDPPKESAAKDVKAGDKPAPDAKPEAAKPDAPPPPGGKPAGTKPPEAKPDEPKPAEPQTAEPKPAEPKQESPKPSDPPPAPTGQTGTNE